MSQLEPANAPVTCARTYRAASRQLTPPCVASQKVTAGLKCAPEIGPNVSINATSTPPVAAEFARSATATLPPDRCSPITPEPTTAARRKQVPTASAVRRRAMSTPPRAFRARTVTPLTA